DVPPGVKAAVESLMAVLNIIVTVLLEKKTRKNSANSGLPPSRNSGPNGNRNKQDHDRNKKGAQLENSRKVATSAVVSASSCAKCGSSLNNVEVTSVEERTKIDIIYEITEHTVQSEVKDCPSCCHENKGKFPDGMDGKVQYGIGIKASIINFLMIQMISLERVQEHFRGLIGRCISQAVMLKYVSQLGEALKGWERREIKRILRSPVIYCDETSLKVDKKNYWIHSYSYGETTLKFLHSKRGGEAIEDIGIIPKYGGTLVHDSWASYLSYDHVDHGLCGAHLLRELKFVEDSVGYKWATKMKKILQEAAYTVANRQKKRVLTAREFARLQSRYRNALTRAKQELPPFPEPTGKRGRPKHTDAQNLWLRLYEYEHSVLLFAQVKEVDFTNNRSERDLRDSKLKQKVSGTFRKEEYARFFVRISSYVKSMRYRGYSSLEAIMLALQGNIPE
ncbi:MAG: IS66 family transposase, partial [Pseudomonadales bacterium]|nr:IS66 family transposase [Pseudomonadales bacterium]